MSSRREVDWERLDKTKFFFNGVGVFSGLLGLLYPLSVIKTRVMAGSAPDSGLAGSARIAREIVKQNGIPGLYRGLGMVVLAAIPTRVIYLSTLEMTKAEVESGTRFLALGSAEAASLKNFIGGATASLASQSVVVPVDVLSQRLMLQDGSKFTHSGVEMMKHTLKTEGIRGLYRGFGASLATTLPSSALWWGFYGYYSRKVWHLLEDPMWDGRSILKEAEREESVIVGVQAGCGILTGITTGFLTNPLDVIKTRLQVAEVGPNGGKPTLRGITEELLRTQGYRGLYRGVGPRMLNTALWGTCMVSAYEFLKRASMKTGEPETNKL